MARRKTSTIPKPGKEVQDAVTWFREVGDLEFDQRRNENEALRFQNADGAWPEDVKAQRSALGKDSPGYTGVPIPARPMISIATLDEPFALSSAMQRGAHLGVNIHALSEDASDATAKILQELYRSIERDSNAGMVRSWAYDRAWWAGRGCYRVDKVYDPYGGHEFDQKLVLRRILDQSTVRLDPYAQEPDWCDGRRGMVAVPMTVQTYKRKYPKSKVASFDTNLLDNLVASEEMKGWIGGGTDETKTVTVAEDWRVDVDQSKLYLLDDGSVIRDGEEAPSGREKRQMRIVETNRVFWRTINAFEVLEEEQEWDGAYIPIIPVIWRELQPHDGRREWIGVVHNAKGSVRLTNFAASGAVEMAALEPKAPYNLDPKQIEGFETYWQQANIRNWPYLPSHRTRDGQTFEPPQRVQVDASRLSPSMQLLSMGFDFVNRATNVHDPALGKQTPAFRSGKAIEALQSQSLESTGGGIDNLANISVMYEAKVMLDLIPRVYDRPERIARVLDEHNTSRLVMFNAPYQPNAQTKRPQAMDYDTDELGAVQLPIATQQAVDNPDHPAQFIDLNKGRYGVEISIGKSYKDLRQEGVSEMGQVLQADPQLMPLIGPEYFEYRGEPWATKVGAILRKVREHNMPWLTQDNQQPTAQQAAQLLAENQQLKGMLGQAALEKQGKVIEQQGKLAIVQEQEKHEDYRAGMDREVKLAVAELSAKVDRLALFYEERARLGTQQNDNQQAAADRAHDVAQSAVDHDHAMQQGAQQADIAAAQSAQDHGQALTENAQQAALQPPANNGASA